MSLRDTSAVKKRNCCRNTSILKTKRDFYRHLSPLDRKYDAFDMTFFSFGAIVSLGFHIYIAEAIMNYGIVTVFSLIFAGFTTYINVMCYAELVSLTPCVGAVYHYCYHTIGELVAFLVGWNMILTYWFLAACMLQTFGHFMDHNFFEDDIAEYLEERFSLKDFHPEMCFVVLNNYPHILCLVMSLVLAGILSAVIGESKMGIRVLTIINMIIICFIFVIYSLFASFKTLDHVTINDNIYETFFGGLMQSYFCFIGYETLMCLGEEAINPSESIPKAAFYSFKMSFVCYTVVSLLHCLVWPSYDQDIASPFSHTMTLLGIRAPFNLFCLLGGFCAFTTGVYAAMFLLIRILYAMSRDGLLLKIFSHVNHYTLTPVLPAFITSIFVGMTGTFISIDNLKVISNLSAIVTAVVPALSLLITRYRCEESESTVDKQKRWVLFNYPKPQMVPTKLTQLLSKLLIFNAVVSQLCLVGVVSLMVIFEERHWYLKYLAYFCSLCCLLFVSLLGCQPQNDRPHLYFQMRGVPYLPLLSIFAHFLMFIKYDKDPWVKMAIWWTLGILFYFTYSLFHSVENRTRFSGGRQWNILGRGQSPLRAQTLSDSGINPSQVFSKSKENVKSFRQLESTVFFPNKDLVIRETIPEEAEDEISERVLSIISLKSTSSSHQASS